MERAKGIYSKRCWIDGQLQEATIYLYNGVIADVVLGAVSSTAEHVVNYDTAVIMPGAIDVHVHINEPGRTAWEGFESATKAAIKGGVTSVVDMPLNSSPVVIDISAFEQKIKACQGKLYANCGFWAGAIQASVADVTELVNAGCLGVKVFLSHSGIDEFPNISLNDLDQLMKGIKHLGVPVLAHCELDILPDGSKPNDDPVSYNSYLRSRPKLWENQAVKRFVTLAKKHNCKAHIVHLASDEIVDWIAEQKYDGVPFTVETCPHYIYFNAEEIDDGNTLLKCAPPIRNKSNRDELRLAVKNGVIDFISSDHSPAPPDIKEIESGDFSKAWGGIAGLQFLLSASWTALKDQMAVTEFIPLITSRPAQFLGIQNRVGHIAAGYNADITIWEPELSFQVARDNIEHRHKSTPYMNEVLFGTILTTIVNGRVAYDKGNIGIVPNGRIIESKQKTGA